MRIKMPVNAAVKESAMRVTTTSSAPRFSRLKPTFEMKGIGRLAAADLPRHRQVFLYGLDVLLSGY